MLSYLRRTLFALLGLLLVSTAVLLLTSREESVLALLWETTVGSPDLGPVDFETLQRRSSPNDALACPAGLCAAKADFDPGVYPGSDEELAPALHRIRAGPAACRAPLSQ